MPRTNNMSFAVFLFFKRIIIPKPELTSNPARSAPKERELDIYNSVIRMLLAQLGINPTMEENRGAKKRLFTRKAEKLSSPTAAMIKPNPTLIRNT